MGSNVILVGPGYKVFRLLEELHKYGNSENTATKKVLTDYFDQIYNNYRPMYFLNSLSMRKSRSNSVF